MFYAAIIKGVEGGGYQHTLDLPPLRHISTSLVADSLSGNCSDFWFIKSTLTILSLGGFS